MVLRGVIGEREKDTEGKGKGQGGREGGERETDHPLATVGVVGPLHIRRLPRRLAWLGYLPPHTGG